MGSKLLERLFIGEFKPLQDRTLEFKDSLSGHLAPNAPLFSVASGLYGSVNELYLKIIEFRKPKDDTKKPEIYENIKSLSQNIDRSFRDAEKSFANTHGQDAAIEKIKQIYSKFNEEFKERKPSFERYVEAAKDLPVEKPVKNSRALS